MAKSPTTPRFQRAEDIRNILNWLTRFRLPVFVVLCLVLGGTSQDIIAPKAVLYFLSLIMIGWALIFDAGPNPDYVGGDKSQFRKMFSGPVLLLLVTALVFIAYLVPMGPNIWTALPGRAPLVTGYEKLGIDLPSLPLSLSPHITFNSLFDFLPPLAVLITVALTRSARELMLTLYAIILVTALSFPFGIMQALNPGTFKFYEISNVGVPVGFFSNSNHQAMFLVMTMPLAIYVASRGVRRLSSKEDSVSKIAMAVMAMILIVVGVLFAESFAGFGLLLLVCALSTPMVFSRYLKRPKVMLAMVLVIGLIVAAAILKAGDIHTLLSDKLNEGASVSRPVYFQNTIEAIRAMGWVGSGPGSFYDVYLMFENRATMTQTFAPHAHNDVIEFILELGAAGFALMALFGGWFIHACVRGVFAGRRSRKLILILLVSILAVILHSLVDYPLRTIALSVFTAFNAGYVSRLLRAA